MTYEKCEFCGKKLPFDQMGWIRLTSPEVQAICPECDERIDSTDNEKEDAR